MSPLIGLLPEKDYLCYWQQLKFLLFAIALAVRGKKKKEKMLSRMDRVLEFQDVDGPVLLVLFPTVWHSIMGTFLK